MSEIKNPKTGQPTTWEDLSRDNEVVESLARICHEANRALCATLGDMTQDPWETAPGWQVDSAKKGVAFHLAAERSASDSHDAWMDEKFNQGWHHGAVKDAEKKTHPALVPYKDLPGDQKFKDYVFRGIVQSYKEYLTKEIS